MNKMTIMKGELLRAIPMDMIAPHEAQAEINHGQTLRRLNERGGLSAAEALAVMQRVSWRSPNAVRDNAQAELMLLAALGAWIAHQWKQHS